MIKAGIIACLSGAVLLATGFFALSYHELQCQVNSNTALIQELRLKDRPLVVVSGKYPEIIATHEDLVIMEEDKDNERD